MSATLCGWRRCFVADQLRFMTRIREEEEFAQKQWPISTSGTLYLAHPVWPQVQDPQHIYWVYTPTATAQIILNYPTSHKTEIRHWRAEADAHWHLGPYSSGHYWRSQWQTWLHACVKAKGRRFEHLLYFATEVVKTTTSDTPKPVLSRATHTTERKITLPFLCNVR